MIKCVVDSFYKDITRWMSQERLCPILEKVPHVQSTDGHIRNHMHTDWLRLVPR